MKNVAFVFARGGSKGLPGKNIKQLAGKPLLQYSIDAALATSSIDRVFVSTDDPAIAEVAKQDGVIVIERPAELASDSSPEWLSWRHAVNWVEKHYGAFDRFISLPATSPLRSVDDIEAAISQLKNQSADICVSMTPASRSPFFNMVKQTSEGLIQLVNEPIKEVTHRQHAPKVFDMTTVIYVTTPEYIRQNTGVFSGRVASIEVPKERAVDIDDIYDFILAEAIIQEQQ